MTVVTFDQVYTIAFALHLRILFVAVFFVASLVSARLVLNSRLSISLMSVSIFAGANAHACDECGGGGNSFVAFTGREADW